jgi:hypothetical protein
MKKKMLMLMAAAVVAACSNESSDYSEHSECSEVVLTFSPYQQEAMTRSAVSIADMVNHLDVWLYESGSEVTAIHQTTSDASFGSVSVTLDKTKTYTLYAVAHKADGATLSDGVITFANDKVTHAMYYSTTFTPATTTNLSCLMQRIVAQFRIETTDAVPDAAKKIQITIDDVFDRWSITAGGTHQVNRVSTVAITSTANDGTVAINVFAIVTDTQTTHTVTVTALDENDAEVQSARVFSDVPLRNGYRTTYRGALFIDTGFAGTFTVENDWNEYDVVNF